MVPLSSWVPLVHLSLNWFFFHRVSMRPQMNRDGNGRTNPSRITFCCSPSSIPCILSQWWVSFWSSIRLIPYQENKFLWSLVTYKLNLCALYWLDCVTIWIWNYVSGKTGESFPPFRITYYWEVIWFRWRNSLFNASPIS